MKYRNWPQALGVTSLIEQAEAARLGLDNEKGIESHLLQQASKMNKPTSGLETVDFQIQLFAGLPFKQQEQLLLLASLLEAKRAPDMTDHSSGPGKRETLRGWRRYFTNRSSCTRNSGRSRAG